MPKIIAQRIRTPDNTILQSNSIHDYRSHVDTVTGENYIVNGGTSYLYIRTNIIEAEDLSVYDTDHFALQRDAFCWGLRLDPSFPVVWRSLRNIDTDRINNILATQTHMEDWVQAMFTQELAFRAA